MKPATLTELKRELKNKTPKELLEVCIRLIKYKKENKELLTYLLFEADDEFEYIQSIKREIDIQFGEMNINSTYYVKKSVRKILRFTNKFIRYSGNKRTEVELLLHYCQSLKNCGVSLKRSLALENIYRRQIQKIQIAIEKLHEDLQYDYRRIIEELD